MPRTSIMALAAAIIAVWVPTPGAAQGGGEDRSGGGRVPAVMDGTYRDPYAYSYEPRGYYPYYGSPYWRPADEMLLYRERYRHELPRYYPAWGYPHALSAVPPRPPGGQ
jgi:hypothetical protein